MAVLKWIEYIRLAFTEILHNKMRTFLTLLGIIIGIGAVMIIIFVVHGAEVFIMTELDNLVPLDLIEVAGRWDYDRQDLMARETLEDIYYLQEKVKKDIRSITAMYQTDLELIYQGKNYDADIIATLPSYQNFYKMSFSEGHFFTDLDLENQNPVVVLGYDIARNLFPQGDALGKKINIYGPYTVIGVLAEDYHSPLFPEENNDNRAFIPLTAYERYFGVKNYFSVMIRAADMDNILAAEAKIIEALDEKYGLVEGESRFQTYNISEGLNQITIVKIVLMVLLSGVASITLLVAGIGIMNIMLVIITERTREIGLRKALGASRKDILAQFIIESIFLCLLGGLLGIGLGYIGSKLVLAYARDFINIEVAVPFWSVLLSLGFTCGVGLFFGIYPAARAAKLDPIEALQYE
ncbi:MAG: ABC transporter permease [Halanaerobiales bacterium]